MGLGERLAETEQALRCAENVQLELEDRLEDTRDALEEAEYDSAQKDTVIRDLKGQIDVFEEDAASSLRKSQRQADNDARLREDLADQLSAARTQLSLQNIALEAAVTESETHKATEVDLRSRLDTYLGELDRVKLAETALLAQVADLRRASADEEVKRAELEKRIVALEADKELLNVALESKETELALTQRRALKAVGSGPGHTPARSRTALPTNGSASMSRLAPRSPHKDEAISTTPSRVTGEKPYSLSHPAPTTRTKRESLISSSRPAASPMPPPATPKARRESVGMTTGRALGEATHHNSVQTPERKTGIKKEVTLSSSLKRPIHGALTKQSSLPTLRTDS